MDIRYGFKHINYRSREGWKYLLWLGWHWSPIMLWPVPALIAVGCLLASLVLLPFRLWSIAAFAALCAPLVILVLMGWMAAYYYVNELIIWFNKRFLGLPAPSDRPVRRPVPKKRQDDNEKKEK